MQLELYFLSFFRMDRWKNEVKEDGWWLMKMKIMLQNQNLNNSEDI